MNHANDRTNNFIVNLIEVPGCLAFQVSTFYRELKPNLSLGCFAFDIRKLTRALC